MKIVINKCYGGFGVTEAVMKEMGFTKDRYLDNNLLGIKDDNYMAYRADERLIKAIEKIGIKKSTANLAELRIVEIPDDVEWEIDDYDGIETVHEKHRSW